MLLTVSSYEVGFGVARGKAVATAGAENCTGDMIVGLQQVNGKYSCKGITSYDPSTGQMGTVDIEIQFIAHLLTRDPTRTHVLLARRPARRARRGLHARLVEGGAQLSAPVLARGLSPQVRLLPAARAARARLARVGLDA